MSGALSGIRVLDLSRVLAGPWAGQILGDLGADVIKVERPIVGDDTRAWGPPFVGSKNGEVNKESAYYLCTNRNKRSVTIDIATAKGQQLVRDLAMQCDVVLENYKVGGLKKYGLDYESLSALNPKLVYCSVTGFGQDGPYATRPGYDFLIQAMGGLMSITGRPDDEPGAGPLRAGVALTDLSTGLYAAIAVLAALNYRHVSGKGQYIDMALLDVHVATLANQASTYLTDGTVPQRMGNGHPTVVPYQDFPTADGDMILAIGNDGQFARFAEIAGHTEWAIDERFQTSAARAINRKVLIPLVRQATVMRTTEEWLRILPEVNVPCGPVNNIKQVFEDPQVKHRGIRIEMPHELQDRISLVANPMRFSESPVSYRHSPPLLGEDTDEVLREMLALDDDTLAELKHEGVL